MTESPTSAVMHAHDQIERASQTEDTGKPKRPMLEVISNQTMRAWSALPPADDAEACLGDLHKPLAFTQGELLGVQAKAADLSHALDQRTQHEQAVAEAGHARRTLLTLTQDIQRLREKLDPLTDLEQQTLAYKQEQAAELHMLAEESTIRMARLKAAEEAVKDTNAALQHELRTVRAALKQRAIERYHAHARELEKPLALLMALEAKALHGENHDDPCVPLRRINVPAARTGRDVEVCDSIPTLVSIKTAAWALKVKAATTSIEQQINVAYQGRVPTPTPACVGGR